VPATSDGRISSSGTFRCIVSIWGGDRLAGELPETLVRDPDFSQRVTEYNFDYFQLIKPFFGRSPRHANDGEYEAIGIGYMLDLQGRLRLLILDDRRPYPGYNG